ncbi:MAG: restriction endonuclease [Eubacteriales bacterium]|nr:restriction endonuclease [Eubacteriales bacterium]
MILVGDLIIRCSSCGAEYIINTDSLDEDTYSIGEFGMGDRVEHKFAGEVDCDNCGQRMSFRLLGFEYPVGVKEYQDSEAEGCEIIEEPYMEMEYDDIPDPILSVYEQILRNPQSVYNLKSWEFEELVAEVYRRNGFNAEVTQRTRDGGRDVIATCVVGGVTYSTYFECKQQGVNNPVGVEIVRALYGVMERDRIDKGVIVTTSRFTRDAIKEAEQLNGRIKLVDYHELQRLMRR